MRILFASRRPFDDSARGGAQQSTRALCRALVQKGIETSILGQCSPTDDMPITVTHVDGIEQVVALDANQLLPFQCDRFKPDVVILSSGDVREMAGICHSRGIPTIFYFRGANFHTIGWDLPRSTRVGCLANSEFVGRTARVVFGLPVTVIRPLIVRSRYLVTSTRERVLFINPLPVKGSRLAYAVARARPDIPFTFVGEKNLSAGLRSWLQQACAQAGNIELHPGVDDMRPLYGRARVVLVPSVWEEGFGRVVAEAQVSGIPVLASRRGGLPEAVGPGGIIEDLFAPVERWAAHLDRLWTDSSYYDQLSQAALAHAARPEISEEGVVDAFVAYVERFLAEQRRRHPPAPTGSPRSPAVVVRDAAPKGPPKVFGIGLSRTGTSTLTRALELLGLRAIHYPGSMDQIRAYDAATDLPIAGSFERLDRLFPDSRFVYTIRPMDAWLKSCMKHFSRNPAPAQRSAIHRFTVYGRVDYDRGAFARAYAAHEERVRTYFERRPGDLLTIDLTAPGDHWDALCGFLGRPRPRVAFPWLNRYERCEALTRRLHEVLGNVEQVAQILAARSDWVAAIVADHGSSTITDSVVSEDEGMEFSVLIKRTVEYFGGIDEAAERLRVSNSIVRAAIERVQRRREQQGRAD